MSHDEGVLSLYPNQVEESTEVSQRAANFRRLGQIIGRCVLTVGLTASFTMASYGFDLKEDVPAFASSDTYPDRDAPCIADGDPQKGSVDGDGYWCDGYDWGYGSSSNSSRGYGYRNCTDWVAWRIPEITGVSVPRGWSHAKYWDDRARESGYSVDTIAEKGDIAVWNSGAYGHVEVVESVNGDGSVNTSAYNKSQDGEFGTRSNVRADSYIDLNGPNRDTSLVNNESPQSDTDNNGAADFVITARRDDQFADIRSGLSTWQGFMQPNVWRPLNGYGYDGITPLVGDVTGDNRADYVFVTNEYSNGVKAFVAKSNGSGFDAPKLWWSGPGYGYNGIKLSLADMDNNNADDLVITALRDDGYADVRVGLSTWQGFMTPNVWRSLDGYGWDGITPLTGDVTGDNRGDYVFVTNEYSHGVKAFVSKSSGSSLATPSLWWNGTGYSYNHVKLALGDADNNGAEDLVFAARRDDDYADVRVALSTWQGFMSPTIWRPLNGYGYDGIKIFSADVTGDKRSDLVFMTNEYSRGVKMFVSESTGSGFKTPSLWWNGSGYSYSGLKVNLD